MRTADVIRHFKTQKGVAAALKMKQPSVAGWGEYPPPARQLQIQKVTRGKLKAEADCLDKLFRIPSKQPAPIPEPQENGG